MHWSRRVAAVLIIVLSTAACGTTYAQRRGYPDYRPYPRAGVYRGGYADAAYRQGFDDGYRRGLEAARDRKRYDPRRERWYRSADRGYSSRWGPRGQYRQAYREAFLRGYDRGYRDGRYRR